MKRKRIYAGTCPRCKSTLTGRIRRGRDGEKYMANGNVFVLSSDPNDHSCACAVCGVKWSGPVTKIEVSKDDLDQLNKEWKEHVTEMPEKTEREILHELLQEESFEEIKTEKKKHGIIGFFKGMFRDTIFAPFNTIKRLTGDVTDMATEYNLFDEKDKNSAPDEDDN